VYAFDARKMVDSNGRCTIYCHWWCSNMKKVCQCACMCDYTQMAQLLGVCRVPCVAHGLNNVVKHGIRA
jgi:hypothetical protein